MTNMMGERFDWGQFRGRLQLNTAAVMGHSYGGTTTLKTLYTDKRFKCVLQEYCCGHACLSSAVFIIICQMWSCCGLLDGAC